MDIKITVSELWINTLSKLDQYRLLQNNVNVNLPSGREENAKYLSDIICGSKSVGASIPN